MFIISVVLAQIVPVIILPIFYKVTPVENEELKANKSNGKKVLNLPLKSRHTFIVVSVEVCLLRIILTERPCAHDEASIAFGCKPTPFRMIFSEIPYIRRKVIRPERFERLSNFVLWQNGIKSKILQPEFAKHLVDVTTPVGVQSAHGRIGLVDEVLSVE